MNQALIHMIYFCTDIMIMKDGIPLLPNTIKNTPHSEREVDLKGGSDESLRTVDIGIKFGIVVRLNTTPEIIKT